ncbi:amidophosphoribosyltransferase [Armatimonas rosea]|uniref:Amidophosphoribosyltransferase n=1 Tax=Armatimonas rosea TaxID=685828 RepID=A0A7W9STP7_ARMRO|nr:amidophosphoribosyltransferase [Armatimonas rosea]
MTPQPFLDDDTPHEECGIFGVWAPGEDVARMAFFGLFALQHRGQESAGIAVSDGKRIALHKDMGLVTQVFDEEILSNLTGYSAIGHTRYSTTGSSVLRNAQPIAACLHARQEVAVAHNGNLINTDVLRAELTSRGYKLESTNDSEALALLIAEHLEQGGVEAVRKAMQKAEGAYSLAILTNTELIGARDPYGVRPLCLGRLSDGGFVLASETCALNTVGATLIREIMPGEIVVINDQGWRVEPGVAMQRQALCMLEAIYFARPDSVMYGQSLHAARRRMGGELSREHPALDADLVIGVPDSGTPAALGFAEASGIPFGEGLIKNRYIQRTFIQPDQRMREMGVRMKLTPIREALQGKSVVMVDDTIVRGTTTGKVVRLLLEAGAREVHVRISAPPVKWPCFYGIDMATQDQLIAASQSVEAIRQKIGATSLGYLSEAGLARAMSVPADNFCLACFSGSYPIPVPENLRMEKLAFEPPVS